MRFLLLLLPLLFGLLISCSDKNNEKTNNSTESQEKSNPINQSDSNTEEVTHYLQVYDLSSVHDGSLRNLCEALSISDRYIERWISSVPLASEETIAFINSHPIPEKLVQEAHSPTGGVFDITGIFTDCFVTIPNSLALFDYRTTKLYILGSKESHTHFISYLKGSPALINDFRPVTLKVNYLEAPNNPKNLAATKLIDLDSATVLQETQFVGVHYEDDHCFKVENNKHKIDCDIKSAVFSNEDVAQAYIQLHIESPDIELYSKHSALHIENDKVSHLGITKDSKHLRLLNTHFYFHNPIIPEISSLEALIPSQPRSVTTPKMAQQSLTSVWPFKTATPPASHPQLSKLSGSQIKLEDGNASITASPVQIREIYLELKAGSSTTHTKLDIQFYKLPHAEFARSIQTLNTPITLSPNAKIWKRLNSQITHSELETNSLNDTSIQLQINSFRQDPIEPYSEFIFELSIKDDDFSYQVLDTYRLIKNHAQIRILGYGDKHTYLMKVNNIDLPFPATLTPTTQLK